MKPGRKNAADTKIGLKVVETLIVPPKPARKMQADERAIWDRTVEGEPEGFFNGPAVRDMLTNYCRHMAMADRLNDVVDEFETKWVLTPQGAKKLKEILSLRASEGAAAAALATKLRLTNQSRYTAEKAGNAARNTSPEAPPWLDNG